MKIPFFHDWDYQGYFGILDKTDRDAIYVSDADVERSHGSLSKAFEEYGNRIRLTHPTSYQRSRIASIS